MKKYILLGGLSSLLLAGCFSGSATQPAYPSINKNPMQITESVERLELHARANGLSLSPRDSNAVGEFISTYSRQGSGPLYMHVPSTLAGARGVQDAQGLIRESMRRFGMPQSRVTIATYQPHMGGVAPVVVSYKRLTADLRDCRSLGDLTRTNGNMPYPEFGCSYHSNLAAMVQNPNQFLAPYPMGPPNAERRKAVYDRYIAGENPASEQPARQENSPAEQ